MSITSFLHFGKAAIEEGVEAADQSMAAHFPTTYSRAAHDQLLESQNALREQVVDAETRLQTAEAKVRTDRETISRIDAQLGEGGAYSKAAYDAASDTAKAQIMAAATALRSEHVKLDGMLAHDMEALTSAQGHVASVRNSYDNFSAKITQFEEMQQRTQDRLADAKSHEQQAEIELASEAQLGKLTANMSSLTTVMSGMNAAADAADRRAKLAEMKVQEAHTRSGSSVEALLSAAESGKTAAVSTDPWA